MPHHGARRLHPDYKPPKEEDMVSKTLENQDVRYACAEPGDTIMIKYRSEPYNPWERYEVILESQSLAGFRVAPVSLSRLININYLLKIGMYDWLPTDYFLCINKKKDKNYGQRNNNEQPD